GVGKDKRIGIGKDEQIRIKKDEHTGVEKDERIGTKKDDRIGIEKAERIGIEETGRIEVKRNERIGIEKDKRNACDKWKEKVAKFKAWMNETRITAMCHETYPESRDQEPKDGKKEIVKANVRNTKLTRVLPPNPEIISPILNSRPKGKRKRWLEVGKKFTSETK
ncbi:21667_t:CDS:2, partial [Cetraspora pellucida]